MRRIWKRAAQSLLPLALAAGLSLGLMTGAGAAGFSDVSGGDWFENAVYFCTDNALFSGVSEDQFAPGGEMTRGMFVTVLGRLAGVPVDHNKSTGFRDVPTGMYYTGYVAWAKANHIVSGVTATTFCPDAPITRQEMCAMIYRFVWASGYQLGGDETTPTFRDDAAIAEWARSAVYSCKCWGLVQGDEQGRFNPEKTAKRSETAQIFRSLVLAINRTDRTVWPERGETVVVNHRGYSTLAPENTISAFQLSLETGYRFVETDVQFTADGVPVLCHDNTINRIARNRDGSELTSSVTVVGSTYEQLCQYDFGISTSWQYAGMGLSTYQELMAYCRANALHPYVELKQSMTEEQLRTLYNITLFYNMQDHVTWISFASMPENLRGMAALDPTAELGVLQGLVTEEDLEYAVSLCTGENIVFFNVAYAALTPEISNAVLQSGFELQVWTVDDPDAIPALKELGVSGITTNTLPANCLD